MRATLVGYKVGMGKNSGKQYCMLHLLVPGTVRDEMSGQIGAKVEQAFVPPEQVNMFTREHVGCEVELEYEISAGKAFLIHVEVCPKEKAPEPEKEAPKEKGKEPEKGKAL